MNSSFLSSLQTWARRASGKADRSPASAWQDEQNAPRYRLQAWPELHDAVRIAPVYRLLSVMTVRSVSRAWMLEQSRLNPQVIDRLITQLQASGDLVQDEGPAPATFSRFDSPRPASLQRA